MVGLTGEIKLRFRDGLVWMAGPTVEIKLRFQILRRGVDAASEKNNVRTGSRFHQLPSFADSTLPASPLLVV